MGQEWYTLYLDWIGLDVQPFLTQSRGPTNINN
jgi:hypothetical protein